MTDLDQLAAEAADIFKSDESLAIFFHDTYEMLAPSFGYETRRETRRFDPESKNGRLMRTVCGAVLLRVKTAIEKAVESAMTRIDMDEQSWGYITLEWRPLERRIYAYTKAGDFLWSGSPSYAVWSCLRYHKERQELRAAHASEQGAEREALQLIYDQVPRFDIALTRKNGRQVWLHDLIREALSQRPTPATEIERPCTCHPDDNPPVPCEHKYALADCIASAQERERKPDTAPTGRGKVATHHNTCPKGERCACYITGYTDAEYDHGLAIDSLGKETK